MVLRKTSYDGADSTSITSGIENEIKKAGSNINKIKKSSIKRKVQNFSHESDDGIIEPLLQTDKEKSDIANKSAKFLLNKAKTDASYKKDNKFGEDINAKSSISTPVRRAIELLQNDIKGSQYIYGMAPIHNYMNTNIFSTCDVTKDMTTKSPILVEIDGTKAEICSSSPLIFTTAKIHTNSKTKLMEPLQVTPVPILSTIEGSVIKASETSDKDKIMNSFTQKSRDSMKSTFDKSNISEARSIKDKQTITAATTCVSSNIGVLNSKVEPNITENQIKPPNKSVLVNSFVKCTGFVDKSKANGQLASNTAETDFLSNQSKVQEMPSISNVKLNTDSSSNELKTTETSKSNHNFKPFSDKSVLEYKASDSLTNNDGYQFTSMHQQKLSSYPKKNPEGDQDNTGISEKSFTASKKLQRQKNAFPQEILQEISKTDKSGVDIGKDKKSPPGTESQSISIKESHKVGGAQKIKVNSIHPSDKSPVTIVTTCNDATSSMTSLIVSRPNATTTDTSVDVLDSKSSVHPMETPKLTIETPVSNSKKTTQLFPATSIKTPPESLASIPLSGKSDIAPSLTSLSYKQSNVAESSFKASSPAETTLPSYIVPTSKTKIGSTFTSITSTTTTKSQMSTPLTETVYTKNAPIKLPGAQQSERSKVGLSPTNGT